MTKNREIKYLFIQIAIQDGERQHDHHVLTTTFCDNVDFAVIWFVAHYWGEGTMERHNSNFMFWFDDEITAQLTSYKVVTMEQYTLLTDLFN